jgi:ATP-dependent protease ClpP protease subunit
MLHGQSITGRWYVKQSTPSTLSITLLLGEKGHRHALPNSTVMIHRSCSKPLALH